MKLVQYNEYLVSTEDTDDLVLQHLGISSDSGKYAPMHFSCLGVKGVSWECVTQICIAAYLYNQFDGLMQNISNPIRNAPELRLFCTKPSKGSFYLTT